MYHVITKLTGNDGRHAIMQGNIESREAARTYAREHGGMVKTDKELSNWTIAGRIVPPVNPTTTEETTVTDNTATNQAAPEGGAQEPEASQPNSIMGAAEQVAGEQAKRTTVGKKEKPEPKRIKTDAATLADAESDMRVWADKVKAGELSKVDFVRKVSLWNGRKLQRSDAIALTAKVFPDGSISPATVSTQFQFARSDRMAEYTERASKREAELKEREAKKAAKKDEAAKKKEQREAEAKAKADQKAAEKKRREDEKAAKAKAKAEEQERKAAEAKAKQEAEAGKQQVEPETEQA